MSLRVLSGGTIVCSALLMYGWVKSLPVTPGAHCDQQPDKTNSANSDRAKAANYCVKKAAISLPNLIPERLLNWQWGNGSKNQLPARMEAEYEAELGAAQAFVSRDRLPQAIAKAAGIPKNSRHFEKAQQLQADWSRELLRQATSEYQQARIAKAMAMLQVIPSTSPLHSQVVELRQRWSQQAGLLNRAMAAKAAGDWQGAIDAIKALEAAPVYHSLVVQNLLQHALIKLYEPDQTLLQIATDDLPSAPMAIAPPELLPVKWRSAN